MKLRILCAAYEAAVKHQRCPDEQDCVEYSKKYLSAFSEEEFRQAGMCHGAAPWQIADEIIEEITSLKEAQELLITYNRWRRGEDIPQPDPVEIGKAIDKLTL